MSTKVPVEMWLCSPELEQRRFLSEEDQLEKVRMCFASTRGSAMTDSGWLLVGKGELTVEFHDKGELTRSAVASVDAQINSLEQAYRRKLHDLREYRSTLLCLEAPRG